MIGLDKEIGMSEVELGRRYTENMGLGKNVTDLGALLGPDARGLYVLGAAYTLGKLTRPLMEYFPHVAQNGMKAQVLLVSQNYHTEHVWVLKKGFWLCRVDVNYLENIATAVAISDNVALASHSLSLLAEKLRLVDGDEDVKGLEGLLAERTKELIMAIPKGRNIRVIG